MGQLSLAVTAIGPVRERSPRESCLVYDSHVGVVFLWEVSTVTRIGRAWDAILVTVDGFGGLT